jgi:hypothetical protein
MSNKLEQIIKIQSWFRGLLLRLKRLPLPIDGSRIVNGTFNINSNTFFLSSILDVKY